MGIPAPADNGYGIPEGLIFGFPCEAKGDGKYSLIKGLEIDEYSRGKIDATLKELESERAAVADLLK
jgi:malate dehydrogenase